MAGGCGGGVLWFFRLRVGWVDCVCVDCVGGVGGCGGVEYAGGCGWVDWCGWFTALALGSHGTKPVSE